MIYPLGIHLMLIILGFDFVVITSFQLFKKRMKFDYHQAIMGLLFSFAFSSLIISFLKTFVGRLRPDFINACQPDVTKVEQQFQMYNDTNNPNYSLRTVFDDSVCTAEYRVVRNGAESFPSSHSQKTFCIMTYLALYIAGQIHLLDRKCYLWKWFVTSIPIFFSVFVALSRISDKRHHPSDVVAGSLIGMVVSIMVYYFYFPSLKSPNCDMPYQDRKGTSKKEISNNNCGPQRPQHPQYQYF
ncbi:PAP2-domain-containing protein [Neocallimastix lanati (nom. inval.)]|uniref:PAP2-domain-containing protein n=1 Tax=Neocallimastix californiae TaxID=1754190 RepID=A0A1Y2D960_9FUNG|nr:PAP2-domain-containing protein [Neocallimastix sp. JGI-2020a]KAG4094299.1 PAP2-domain-containing protein [Neocallimastix sp. JGI-2020a]ORY55801.1 PAP2-domain-containing protein [Neocallimastix californiae]|eukprot:ORY55801.1 PAP2-domain-containing protein [Neocallimastix californiae]